MRFCVALPLGFCIAFTLTSDAVGRDSKARRVSEVTPSVAPAFGTRGSTESYDDRCVGVDADFDDGGGEEGFELAGAEGVHDALFFGGAEAAVDEARRAQQRQQPTGTATRLPICCTRKAFRFPAFPVQGVDRMGAGDAFNGGLAAGLAAGGTWEQALPLANAAVALTCTRRGCRKRTQAFVGCTFTSTSAGAIAIATHTIGNRSRLSSGR